jgi:putative transposase
MTRNHHSLRLKDHDYTLPGPYFITTVTHSREGLLGNVVDGGVVLNEFGMIVRDCWIWLGEQFPYLELGESIVMPDHFHGIIQIGDPQSRRDRSRPVPTGAAPVPTGAAPVPTGAAPAPALIIKPLGQLIGAFKTVSAKRINLLRGTPGSPVWQRDFHDRIVRDEEELARIHQYIQENPRLWQPWKDENFLP